MIESWSLKQETVVDAFSVPLFKIAPEKSAFTNHAPLAASESELDDAGGRTSLYSVKVIKISRLDNNRLLILWLPHGSLRCCKTDCTNFLSLDM